MNSNQKITTRNKQTNGHSSLSRRKFVTGVATGGTVIGLGLGSGKALSLDRSFDANKRQTPQELSGNTFNLSIDYVPVNFTGHDRIATTVNGSVPSPVLRWKEGERVTLRVTNNLDHDSSIHWHGIILPTGMDGVPGLSFNGIKPGETFEYQFDVNQSGTYWYHSHSGFQEQTGMYGAIVIEPKDSDPVAYDRDYVVLLSDWSDEAPEHVYATLKKLSHYYNFNERTVGDLWRDIKEKGLAQTWKERKMWNTMRMSQTDLADVTAYTYTFLMNGVTPADGWMGLFKPGEKVRLRFINSAAMTIFDVRIPGLKMTVVAADGQNIQPVSVDEFRIGVAETYDVIVEPETDNAYTIFAQTIDRSGYTRGTLTSDINQQALIPEMDKAPLLAHRDMGMSHNMAGMSGVSAECTPEHAAMGHCTMDKPMAMPKANNSDSGCTPEHAAMGHCVMEANGKDASAMNHGDMKHHGQGMKTMQEQSSRDGANLGKAGFGSTQAIHHQTSEFGPHVDMRADDPMDGLHDPGVGLRDHQQRHNRRVLTYADLRSLHPTRDTREPSREIQLHLTGNMERYMWSMDGVKFADADPIQLTYGERVRITLVNDTMMTHPVHLHGMWSELETGDPEYIPRKHTVIVQPGSKISYLVTADALGRWAYHCHLLYHMPGMFREVRVSKEGVSA